ncbi:MAG TPA: shikimate dehydrogenase, partial [Candidatus Omnitrophota bacterium]|nr:shikimate dehydrogenase [Candidatus Omnitrophota bacterium]
VISEKRKLIGHNTDGPGFLTHLTELGVNPQNKNIFILGAGGAARAVISVLCLIPERPKSIKIYDVDQSKAKQLIADLSQRMDSSLIKIVDGIFDSDMCMTDFLINATPIGLKDSDPVLIDEKFFNKNMFVYDLIYNPFETKLLKQAKEKGAKASNGLGMLYYQGVLAFQHWAGVDLEENIKNQMRQALEGGLKK